MGRTQDRTFTITNMGGGTLSGRVSSSSPDFSVRGESRYVLDPGGSASFRVTFSPLMPGADSGLIRTGVAGSPAIACSGRGTGWSTPHEYVFYLVLRPDGSYGTNLPVDFSLDYLDLANLDKGDGPSFVFLPNGPQPQAWLRVATPRGTALLWLGYVFGAQRVILAGVSVEAHGSTKLELRSGACNTELTLPATGGDLDVASGLCDVRSSVDSLNAGLRYSDFNRTTGWLGVRQITFIFGVASGYGSYPAPELPAARRGHFTLRRAR